MSLLSHSSEAHWQGGLCRAAGPEQDHRQHRAAPVSKESPRSHPLGAQRLNKRQLWRERGQSGSPEVSLDSPLHFRSLYFLRTDSLLGMGVSGGELVPFQASELFPGPTYPPPHPELSQCWAPVYARAIWVVMRNYVPCSVWIYHSMGQARLDCSGFGLQH